MIVVVAPRTLCTATCAVLCRLLCLPCSACVLRCVCHTHNTQTTKTTPTNQPQGKCSNQACPYAHIKVASDAPPCKDFLSGYCPRCVWDRVAVRCVCGCVVCLLLVWCHQVGVSRFVWWLCGVCCVFRGCVTTKDMHREAYLTTPTPLPHALPTSRVLLYHACTHSSHTTALQSLDVLAVHCCCHCRGAACTHKHLTQRMVAKQQQQQEQDAGAEVGTAAAAATAGGGGAAAQQAAGKSSQQQQQQQVGGEQRQDVAAAEATAAASAAGEVAGAAAAGGGLGGSGIRVLEEERAVHSWEGLVALLPDVDDLSEEEEEEEE